MPFEKQRNISACPSNRACCVMRNVVRFIHDHIVPALRIRDRWSIMVSGNWRMTFEFEDGNVFVLDYEDYH